jgi:hypothetical protein
VITLQLYHLFLDHAWSTQVSIIPPKKWIFANVLSLSSKGWPSSGCFQKYWRTELCRRECPFMHVSGYPSYQGKEAGVAREPGLSRHGYAWCKTPRNTSNVISMWPLCFWNCICICRTLEYILFSSGSSSIYTF